MNEQLKEYADELKQQKEAVVAQAQKIADLQAKLDDSEGECKRTSAALNLKLVLQPLKNRSAKHCGRSMKEQDQAEGARIKELEDQIASLRTKLTVDENPTQEHKPCNKRLEKKRPTGRLQKERVMKGSVQPTRLMKAFVCKC